jgi:hypothetical protein
MNTGYCVDFYGVKVEYDPNVPMGVFEPVPWLNNALAYKPTTALEIQDHVRMLSREQGIEHLEGILRCPATWRWTPHPRLAGQPSSFGEVSEEVANSSDLAGRALVALGRMKESRPRTRRSA